MWLCPEQLYLQKQVDGSWPSAYSLLTLALEDQLTKMSKRVAEDPLYKPAEAEVQALVEYTCSVALHSSIETTNIITGFPGGSVVKNLLQCRRCRFDHRVRKIPWERKWQSTPALPLGKSLAQRSLVGYSPWGCKVSDMTEVT